MGESGRDLLAMVRDQDDGRGRRICSQRGEADGRRSRAPKSRPANGSSSRISSGSLISARASSTCWRSPSEITPNGRSPSSPTLPRVRSPSAFSQSSDVYRFHHVSSAPCRPLATTSRAGRSARSCRVTAPLTNATRGRSVRTSTWPRRAPSTSTVPAVGHSRAAATWSSVVLPEPFGPRITQRSPISTRQSIPCNTGTPSRCTVTPPNAIAGGGADPLTPRCCRHHPRDAG